MTAWLDFRTEPVLEDDYVIGLIFPPNEQPYVQCSCGFQEGVTNEIDAEDTKYKHAKWHDEGMQQ